MHEKLGYMGREVEMLYGKGKFSVSYFVQYKYNESFNHDDKRSLQKTEDKTVKTTADGTTRRELIIYRPTAITG